MTMVLTVLFQYTPRLILTYLIYTVISTENGSGRSISQSALTRQHIHATVGLVDGAAMLRITHGRKPHGTDFGGPLRLALVRNVEPENRWGAVPQAAQRPTFL